MRKRTVVAFVSLSCLLGLANISAARAGGGDTSSTTSKSTHKKAASHKHKHYSKRQPPGQKAPTADRVSEIQSALARGGYYQGDPNGKLDSNTTAALQKFQSANGLDANGKLDAPTLQKLGLGSDIAGVGAPKPIVPASKPGASSTPSSAPTVTAAPIASKLQPPSPAPVTADPTSTAPQSPKPAQQ